MERGESSNPNQEGPLPVESLLDKDWREFTALNRAYENYMRLNGELAPRNPKVETVVKDIYSTKEDRDAVLNYISRKSHIIYSNRFMVQTKAFQFTDNDPGRLVLNEHNILLLRHFVGKNN